MTVITDVHNSVTVHETQSQTKFGSEKRNAGNIFAAAAERNGMHNLADFFREDWSANMARKAGYNKFADWIENKDGDSDNIVEDIARAAVKHPILTIATIALSIFAGRQLYKSFAGKAQIAKAGTATKIATPPAPAAAETITAKTTELIPNDVEAINKIIDEGLEYERKINYRNLEILQNSTEQERNIMLSYFRATKKEKDLLLFASGNKPAMIEGIPHMNDDIFDSLASNSVKVAEFFSEAEGNLIMNKKEVCRVIGDNLTFFRQRLGLPETATIDEVFHHVKKSYANSLRDGKKFADLRSLLLGYPKYDAYHAQLVQDLKSIYKTGFYDIYRDNLENYKEMLKKIILDEHLTYGKMSPEFQADLIKKIDTLTQQAYRDFLIEPMHVFADATYDKKQLEALRDLALKLRKAQAEGASIGL